MDMQVQGIFLTGTLPAIAAKSMAHRLLICAALSQNSSRIRCEQVSNDISSTVQCLQALGARIERVENEYIVTPIAMSTNPTDTPTKQALPTLLCKDSGSDFRDISTKQALPTLLCRDSGSTLRFLLPVVAALGKGGCFHLEGRLPNRPLSPLYEELVRHGATLSPTGQATLSVSGNVKAGSYTLAGDISSQYFSGLLFALPLLHGDSQIHIEGRLESRQYVDMTLQAIRLFGIKVQETQNSFIIAGGQQYRAPDTDKGQIIVEGDWSNAAFWLCAGALSAKGIKCTNLNMQSLQGDRDVVSMLEAFGAHVERHEASVFVRKDVLKGITIDAEHIPDLIPVLSVVASVAQGTTTIINAKRLRLKESDRLQAVHDVLKNLGADITIEGDGLIINGVASLQGGRVSSYGDHRMAMMAAVASVACQGEIIIEDASAVEKSYPTFYDDFAMLGGIKKELQ